MQYKRILVLLQILTIMVLLKMLQLPYKNMNIKQKFVLLFHLETYLQKYGCVEAQKSRKP